MSATTTPILRSFNEKWTKAFDLDFLGFELVFDERAPLNLAVRKGECDRYPSEHYGDARPGAPLRIGLGNVSAYVAELRATGFGNSCPGELREIPWGTREITIPDPASNRLTFFSPVSRDFQD